MSEAAVEFRDVHYSVSGKAVLRGFALRASDGETVALLGRSGSGKTTALRLVNAMLTPTRGEVLVRGKDVRELEPIALRRRTGYVIQESGLFPHWTVRRNIALVPRLEGWAEERVRSRVDELLALVGLAPAEFAERFPHELSGGQRQRVGVARALAADPPLLLMDEPFGALDPITRAELQQEFKKLQQRLHKTVLLVTHDLREALTLADKIALVEDGRVVAMLPSAEFVNSAEPVVRSYVAPFQAGEAGLVF